jgi:hypothetical protein
MRNQNRRVGFVLGLSVLYAAACNGQTPPAGTAIPTDAKATVSFVNGKPSVEPVVAIVSSKAPEFQWVVGKLPDGYTVEIDFRVHDGAKGPFKAKKSSTGRYTGGTDAKIPAGEVVNKGRNGWKYDLVIRDADGNDQGAIDPMVIVAE